MYLIAQNVNVPAPVAPISPVLMGLSAIASLGLLVCFIMVLVKMFQNGKTGLGIASILTCCCIVGQVIALVVGWQNADRWRIRNLMIAYTVFFAINLAMNALTFPAQYRQMQLQMQEIQRQQQQAAQGAQPAVPVQPAAP